MMRMLLVVIAVSFFLLARNGEAQPFTSTLTTAIADDTTAVPAKAALVGGSEEVEVKATQGMKLQSKTGTCYCPPPSPHGCHTCKRMRCLLTCYYPYVSWNICQYCSECEASSAGFTPYLHCWTY